MGGSPNLCEAEGKVRVGPARCGQMAGRTESNQGGRWVLRTNTHRNTESGCGGSLNTYQVGSRELAKMNAFGWGAPALIPGILSSASYVRL